MMIVIILIQIFNNILKQFSCQDIEICPILSTLSSMKIEGIPAESQEQQKYTHKFTDLTVKNVHKIIKELNLKNSLIILNVPFFLILLGFYINIFDNNYTIKQASKASTLGENVIFRAGQKLNRFNKTKQTQQITAVFTSSNRYDLLQLTLSSFFTKNTYPLKQVIVIDDFYLNPQIRELITKYPNITWISANRKIGQMYAIDIAYSFITTQYFYHSEDDWLHIRSGFIEDSLRVLKRYPNAIQTLLHGYVWPSGHRYGFFLSVDTTFTGLSFNPALHRMKQYRLIADKFGRYSQFVGFNSFGTGAGSSQYMIAEYYVQRGYRTFCLSHEYVAHLGQGRGLGIK